MSENALYDLAAQTLASLGERTLATAESLTGGLISATLTEVPGASRVFRGSIVTYSTDVKVSVLGVDPALISAGGAVQEQVAFQMARGVCRSLRAQFGLAVTGVAGPASQDGHDPGTVCFSVVEMAANGAVLSSQLDTLVLDLGGVAPEDQRAYIRSRTVRRGLELLKSMALGQVSE
jgi:nicotinamide-nucleotide amidase